MLPLVTHHHKPEGGSGAAASEGVLSCNQDKLRSVLLASSKEAAFRKVVQATMVRDRQHGPVVELNRIALRRSRSAGQQVASASATVFVQMVNKMALLTHDVLMLPHRTWKVKFVGTFQQFDVKFLRLFFHFSAFSFQAKAWMIAVVATARVSLKCARNCKTEAFRC